MNRYIYHYNAITKGGAASMSGIAQLNFRIKSQEDLNVLKRIINRDGFIVHAVTSLSYLGRENDDEETDNKNQQFESLSRGDK